MGGVGVAAVLVADRRVDGLASFTLEPGRYAVDMDLGKKMVSRWRCDRWWAFLGRAETPGKRRGMPSRGCRGCTVGAPRGRRGPPGMRSPGKVESTRRARSIRSAVPSLRRRRRLSGSAATVSPTGTTGRLSGCYGSIEGIGWMRGCVQPGNGAHLDRQRVAKSGDWEVASAIIVQHQATSPSSGSAPPLVVAQN